MIFLLFFFYYYFVKESKENFENFRNILFSTWNLQIYLFIYLFDRDVMKLPMSTGVVLPVKPPVVSTTICDSTPKAKRN
jgi:hypothetical protein